MTLFLWRSHRLVFLDQVCINQTDQRLKGQALASIGAFLKYSDSFVLVWDTTYVHRLWCVIELGAYLTSHPSSERQLYVRPSALAPCVLSVSLGMWISFVTLIFAESLNVLSVSLLFLLRWMGFYIAAAVLRTHYRDTERMLEQLQAFTVEHTQCKCCDVGHTAANGTSMICDRDVVTECVKRWFGSVQKFEEIVRSDVRATLYRQLGGLLFPYRWLLMGSSPLLWGFIDAIAPRARAGRWDSAAVLTVYGLTWWLFTLPSIFALTLLFAQHVRKPLQPMWLDPIKTLMVSLVLTIASIGGQFLQNLLPAPMFVGGSVLVAGGIWLMVLMQRRRLELTQQQSHHSLEVLPGPVVYGADA